MATKSIRNRVGEEAVQQKGWLVAHKWLLLRRISQISILMIFLAGPLFSVWIIKGNMTSSLLLETIPLSDPFVFLQTLASGVLVDENMIIGAVIIAAFYFMVGGRVYCSWVCPVNAVTDAADWLRRALNIRNRITLSRDNRSILLVAIILVSMISGMLVWELVNPVTMIQRELVFAMGFSWVLMLAIFILDAFFSRRAWCGHLCPMGKFYSMMGRYSPLKVNALHRSQCDDCMDCYAVCPEPQVIKPALKGDEKTSPVIFSGDCTNCGQCIDVCAKDVFSVGHRFITPIKEIKNSDTSQREVSL